MSTAILGGLAWQSDEVWPAEKGAMIPTREANISNYFTVLYAVEGVAYWAHCLQERHRGEPQSSAAHYHVKHHELSDR